MTIVRSIKSTTPEFGAGDYKVQNLGVSVTTAGAVVPLPASGSLIPIGHRGKIRISSATVGSSGTLQVTLITVTDGTTTEQIYAGDKAATAANVKYSREVEWISDLDVTSISVTVAAGTATSTLDFEVVYAV